MAFLQIKHMKMRSSAFSVSRAPPCVASPFPSTQAIVDRATAPKASPASQKEVCRRNRSEALPLRRSNLSSSSPAAGSFLRFLAPG
uniref:Uncharacterized protein n=1 Tax=Oryza glumipatula TaxID=40148 RepID=A0A0E0BSU0_9ORYZ